MRDSKTSTMESDNTTSSFSSPCLSVLLYTAEFLRVVSENELLKLNDKQLICIYSFLWLS